MSDREAEPQDGSGGSGRERDVLERLDDNVPSGFIWRLTILSCLGGLLFGFDTSNIGSALNFVPKSYGLTSGFWSGYLVAGASLGAAVGAILAGPLTDRFGRKALLVADAGVYAVGSILSAVAPDGAVLLFARTLIGLAIGADSAIATAYIAEWAPRDRRGSLTMLQQWMITVGILLAYVVALIVLRIAPGSAGTVGWRIILGVGAIPAIIGLILRAEMPESPRWLMKNGKYDKVREAMDELGIEVSVDAVKETAERLQRAAAREERRAKTAWTPGVRRALVVVCMFFVFQQITGINVPLYYGPHLLGPLLQGSSHSLVWTTIAGVEVTAMMTVVNVAATYFGFKYIDKLGRRPLSMGGYSGMIVFALIAAAGIGFLSGTSKTVLVMVGLCGFIASFAIGVGGTGWTIQGETFPTEIRGQAAATGATADWLANFALIEVFPTWNSGIGLDWVLVCFAALSAMAIVFIYRYLPETKGLSVEQITARYEEVQSSGSLAPVTQT
ncbi:MAG TPA: sugar porter family MFS transporter [Solirubrobacteraceae bacterium]|nr:sugar porter family MFS transporter [Solirubrobacteraceae bacterium]